MKQVLMFLMVLCTAVAFAEEGGKPVRPFQLGIVPPLSLNGQEAPNTINHFAADVIWGVSAGVEGFEVNGIGSTTFGQVNGFQISGVINVVQGGVSGTQITGFMNLVKGDVHGVQAGGFMNIADKVQVAQAAGFMSIAHGSVTGIQGAGFMSIGESVQGLQFGGLMSISEQVTGMQNAGLMNITEKIEGLQYAGLMNIAEKVNGVQAAGLMNIAGQVNGLMLAGLMNLAESCAYPIGLINLIDDGWRKISFSGDELGTFGVSFKSGGKTYGGIGTGSNAREAALQYNTHAALGFTKKLGKAFALNVEAGTTLYFEKWKIESFKDEMTQIHSLKLLLDYSLGRFGLYAGPTLNLMLTNRSDAADLISTTLYDRTCDCDFGRYQKLYPGATAGIYYRMTD